MGVPAALRRGTRVDVWTDAPGAIVPAAPSSAVILQQALFIGAFADVGAVSVAHVCVRRSPVRRWLDRREHDRARTEPDWTRRTA
ncbi:hypothetical protein ACFWJM_00235 [Streptomyces sp. NPDC127077]|uniref:hypothetical protein n=1 Tax=Streptomyces sp. NPDC127077 TaxID=3347131 RepID=UPI003668BB3A